MDEVLEKAAELHYGEMVQEIKGGGASGRVSGIVTNKGEYQVDLVIMAIGFRPNTALGEGHIKKAEGSGATALICSSRPTSPMCTP